MRRRSGLRFNHKRRKVNVGLVREILLWIVEGIVVVALALFFVYAIGQKTTVIGSSMSETLKDGEGVLMNKIQYSFMDPKVNDVIVFLPNGNEKSHYYIKRVIAVPGDSVQIISGGIYVNKKLFVDKFDAPAVDNPGLAKDEIVLGEDEYFVLGDNRNDSEDSRFANIGNVKKEYIVGKVWVKISPFKAFGFVR